MVTKKFVVAVALSIVFTAVVLIAVGWFLSSGSVTASVDNNALHVDAPGVNSDVYFTEIDSVEIRSGIVGGFGTRTNGFGGSEISSGQYNNSAYGSYTLAVHSSVHKYIVVHKTGYGSTLVFNLGSEGETIDFYNELQKHLIIRE
jgi:hypothetical protein